MVKNDKTITSSLSEIKRNLDPDSSYMIFEYPEGEEEAEFREIKIRLSRFGEVILEKEAYRDEDQGTIIFVVRLSPNKAEEIMQEFLSMRLSKNVSFYYYGACPRESKGR